MVDKGENPEELSEEESCPVTEQKQKPFPCSQCPYSFVSNAKLKYHIDSVHLGIKQFECSYCDYSCARKANLKRHIEVKHENNKSSEPYECTKCDETFSAKSYLRVHFKVAHEGKNPVQNISHQPMNQNISHQPMNPWLVESVNSFLYLKCPECVFDTEYVNEEIFQYHALENHPWSNVLFGDVVKVDPNANENQILNSIKKENHDEYEAYDFSYNGEIAPEISVSDLKVEFSEEGEENKFLDHEGQYMTQEKSSYDFKKSKKEFQCSACPISFKDACKLKEHFKAVHEGLKPFSCSLCNYKCARKPNLRRHIECVHEGKTLEEGEDNKDFVHEEKSSYVKESRKEYDRKRGITHQCSACPVTFAVPSKLKEHFEAVHEGKKPHVCSICDKAFGFKKGLNAHIDKHHPDKATLKEKELLKGSGFNKIEDLVKFRAFEETHGPFKRENGSILCSYCEYRAERPAKLEEHIPAVHEGKKPHSCPHCDKCFGMKANLKVHVDSVHEGKRYKCDSCGKDFVTPAVLRKHIEVVHEKIKPLKCPGCDLRFNVPNQLKRHFESMHEGRKYNCPHCDAIYSQKQALGLHIKEYHPHHKAISNGDSKDFDNKIDVSKPFQCLNCSESFVSKNDLNTHNNSVHGGTGPQKCSQCEFSCTRKEILVRHIKSQHEGKNPDLTKKLKSLLCTVCNQQCFDLASFKDHINSVHQGQKPFPCSLCDKSFFLRVSWKTHVAVHHEGIKKGAKTEYPCTICNVIFERKYQLTKHGVTEHGEKKPFPCPLCDDGFILKAEMKTHIERVHEGKRYYCERCESSFSMEASLKKHVEQVHEKRRPHLCTICGSSSKTKQALELHIAHVHENKKSHMCSICGYECVMRFTLTKHMRIVHEKIKAFICPVESCDYKGGTRGNLRVHLEKHGGIKPYDCHLCDSKFYNKHAQKAHIKNVHEKGKLFNCPYCTKTFSRKSHMKRHANSHNMI